MTIGAAEWSRAWCDPGTSEAATGAVVASVVRAARAAVVLIFPSISMPTSEPVRHDRVPRVR
jgi:hypothetical protein